MRCPKSISTPAPYIRKARRIRAEFTVLEEHVGAEQRGFGEESPNRRGVEVTGERFHDSVGVGCYRIDLHPSTGKDNYIDVAALPFQIPLGALIPRRMKNLLPAAKNIATTHVTNGCYRLHPVEWNIGEVAGYLAATCLDQNIEPQGIRNHPGRLSTFQRLLDKQGIEREWPTTPRI